MSFLFFNILKITCFTKAKSKLSLPPWQPKMIALLSIFSFFLGFWYFIQKIFEVDITPGLPTNVLLITFFSGIQLLALGLIGEYVGRIYDQVKQRPSYIIEKKINFDE